MLGRTLKWVGRCCARPIARAAVVAALAAGVGQQVCNAATISFHVERNGEGVVIEASALIDADAATAWGVLTDYERYAEFIPDVRSSRVVSRRGGEVVVQQTGSATFWAMRAPVDVTYRIDEEAPSRLVSRASAGGVHALDSVYALTRTADGVRLDYHGRVSSIVGLAGPPDAGERNAERSFRALAAEIERASGAHESKRGQNASGR